MAYHGDRPVAIAIDKRLARRDRVWYILVAPGTSSVMDNPTLLGYLEHSFGICRWGKHTTQQLSRFAEFPM